MPEPRSQLDLLTEVTSLGRRDDVLVVLPTYNEADNIEPITAAILEQGPRLLVVDDGSPDGTGVPIVFKDREAGDSKMSTDIAIEAMRLVTMWGLGRLVGRLPWPSREIV